MTLRNASIIATAVLVVAVLGLFALRKLLADRLAFAVPQVVAGMLRVWARMTFGARSFHAGAEPTAGELVTTGPYPEHTA